MQLKDKASFRKNKTKKEGSGTAVIGFTSGLLTALFLYLLLAFNGSLPDRDKLLAFIPAISGVIVSACALFVSFRALREQRIMRQAGTDPVLVAHVKPREDHPSIVHLLISNVGAGAARNVSATLQYDGDLPKSISKEFIDNSALGNGQIIGAILQNTSVSFMLGVAHELLNDSNGAAPFYVNLHYEDIDGNKHSDSNLINVKELQYQPANEPTSTKLWREAEKIGKQLELIRQRISRG